MYKKWYNFKCLTKRKDDLKFKNFTRKNSKTFDFIFNEIGEIIRLKDTNFRTNITPAENYWLPWGNFKLYY